VGHIVAKSLWRGLRCNLSQAIEPEKSQWSSHMAGTQTQPTQGGPVTKPAQPKDHAPSAAAGDAQPVFRDWAAI
jgi:hypothetical protein